MIDLPIIQIDIWQLTASLLVVALLNEFLIKPLVEMIRGYYHKVRGHIQNGLKK
jgi:F0F1-type ATP synthase membrane subunit b/b'